MNMAMRRWMLAGTDKGKLLFKAFDHLRLLVGFRKLMKY